MIKIGLSHIDIITVVSKEDTEDFECLYNGGLPGHTLINPTRLQVKEMLEAHTYRPLLIFGHGDERGLYDKDYGYLIGAKEIPLLRQRSCIIGVWCYASNFADHYDLKGFFTSMFISNMEEAIIHQVDRGATPEKIKEENIKFAKNLKKAIIEKQPIENWAKTFQDGADISLPFVRFNYEALSYFD